MFSGAFTFQEVQNTSEGQQEVRVMFQLSRMKKKSVHCGQDDQISIKKAARVTQIASLPLHTVKT